MRFRGVIEDLVGSRVKSRLLMHILNDEESLTSERELAKLIGFSHSAVSKTLKDFQDLNLITPLRVGNSILWRLNKQSYAYSILTNLHSYAKKSPLQDLKEKIMRSLQNMNEVMGVVLYGSIAEGRESPESDIDLFILVTSEKSRNNPQITYALQNLNNECIERYGNRVSANIMTFDEYRSKKSTKFIENVKKGTLLTGNVEGVQYAMLPPS